ncbi:MAG: hypothetical protein WA831_04250 [Methylovirgula sp.]
MTADPRETLVTTILDEAFNSARAKKSEIYKRWISVFFVMGAQLPESLLPVNVQRDGELDLLLRCMEDEFLMPETAQSPFKAHYNLMLASVWVGSIYETVRLLREVDGKQTEFDQLAHDLRLLRVTLEKHQIADDHSLKNPLDMMRRGAGDDATRSYMYDPNNPHRSHIMPMGLSSRGSAMWQVTDIKKSESRWIERRDLSDRVLDQFSRI